MENSTKGKYLEKLKASPEQVNSFYDEKREESNAFLENFKNPRVSDVLDLLQEVIKPTQPAYILGPALMYIMKVHKSFLHPMLMMALGEATMLLKDVAIGEINEHFNYALEVDEFSARDMYNQALEEREAAKAVEDLLKNAGMN